MKAGLQTRYIALGCSLKDVKMYLNQKVIFEKDQEAVSCSFWLRITFCHCSPRISSVDGFV
jgi:hypothetical protein